jgi:hypothetical protein
MEAFKILLTFSFFHTAFLIICFLFGSLVALIYLKVMKKIKPKK